MIYTDNNGVRDSLISCNAANPIAKQILLAVLELETDKQFLPWYGRVPTDSNLADLPSRFELQPTTWGPRLLNLMRLKVGREQQADDCPLSEKS